jgi:glutathione synthase
MGLRVAVQMDPIEHVDIKGDTSFALIETAQEREGEVFVYGPEDLSWNEGRVQAHPGFSISRMRLMSC